MFTNIVLSNWKTGFNVEHDECIAAVAAGTLKATNVNFVADVPSKSKGKDTAGASADVSAIFTEGSATGAGNGVGTPSWAAGWSVGF
jgi:hypothetical protein